MPQKKRSAFMEFAEDYAAQKGLCVNKAKMVEIARPIWMNMSEKEKNVYTVRAKTFNSSLQVPKKKEEEILAIYQMEKGGNNEKKIKEVEKSVQNAFQNNTLRTDHFFFLSVNYFNHTLEGDYYVPAEIAICKFSLKEGLIDVYHTIINPGQIPYGYQYRASNYSDSTHCLPLPPNALGERNYTKIFSHILKFITGDKVTILEDDINEQIASKNNIISISVAKNYKIPEIYTKTEEMEIAKSILDTLCSVKKDGGTISGGSLLPLHSLEYLLLNMKLVLAKILNNEPPKNIYIIDIYFSKDPYEYERNIACNYHEECDRSNYCTRSLAIRWVYMFSSSVCKDFGIEPIPGKHLPIKGKAVINCETESSNYMYIDNLSKTPQKINNTSNKSSTSRLATSPGVLSLSPPPPQSPWNNISLTQKQLFTGNLLSSDFPEIGSRVKRSPAVFMKRGSSGNTDELLPKQATFRSSSRSKSSENILDSTNNTQKDIQQQNGFQRRVIASAEKPFPSVARTLNMRNFDQDINRSMKNLDIDLQSNKEKENKMNRRPGKMLQAFTSPSSSSSSSSPSCWNKKSSNDTQEHPEDITSSNGRGSLWHYTSPLASNRSESNRGRRGSVIRGRGICKRSALFQNL